MNRGDGFRQTKGVEYPIYFTPMTNQLQQFPIKEEFRDITDEMVPGIYPWYCITNYGRIWHKYLQGFLNINIDSKGYSYKPLATISGPKVVRVHRIVLMAFQYREDCNSLLVNHIDGNKMNNMITNLEWTTYSGNAQHAYDHGLISRTHACKYDDPVLIHSICQDLQNNMLSNDIAISYNIPLSLVESVKYKKAHREISDQYSFNITKYRRQLTEDEVRAICTYYSTHPREDNSRKIYYDALESIGIKDASMNEMYTAQRIYTRRIYTSISNEYKW